MMEENREKNINIEKIIRSLKALIIPLILILTIACVGIGSIYVINRQTFITSVDATATYTGNAYLDPEKGIVVEKENEDGSVTEVSVEEILEKMDGSEVYLKDDENSTREEKLKYLMNAELVTKFPYINSLEGDESKLNGVLKFYRYTTQLEAEDAENNLNENEDKNNIEQNVNPKEIFYIGDSWMDGLKSYLSNNAKDEYPGEEHFLAVSGHGAQSAEFSTEKLKKKIDNVSSEVSAIIIMLGLNDRSNAAANKMNQIIDFLATTYTDKIIYVLKVPHVGEEYRYNENFGAVEINAEIDKYNPILLEFCSEKKNVKFIDVTNNMMTEDLYYLDKQYLYKDGLHLNNEGNQLWYSNIKGCISQGKTSAEVEKYQMIYLKEEDFETKVKNSKSTGNKEIFKYFTINEEGEIVIATWRNTSKTVATNDPEITAETLKEGAVYDFSETEEGVFSAGRYTITTTNLISYDTLVEKYALPFNLLWAFLVQTKDYELTAEIAKLAYESEIKIGIYDNQTTSIQNNSETYNKSIRYTENTELIFPGVNQTTPSININDSKYNDVIRGCYGEIIENVAVHKSDTKIDSQNKDDGNLYTYYISSMDENGNIKGVTLNQEDAAEFTITTHTTTTSASSPAIGVFYVDNWIATWKASYQLTAGETTSISNSGTSDDEYESISEDRISNSVIESNLTKHSQNLKEEAIKEIVENTTFSVPAITITESRIAGHIKGCTDYCQKKIETAYRKTLEKIEEDKELEGIAKEILASKDYKGTNLNSSIKKEIYTHLEDILEKQRTEAQENMRNSFISELATDITYSQWPTAEKANVNIQYESLSTKNPYSYDKDTTIIEDEGIKFKNIISKPEYYESKQAILERTEWFWEYIRKAEDTAKLEDVLRVIFNLAFDTNKFGTFSLEEIERIFKAFEPKLRKVGMGHTQAFQEWMKSYENNSLRRYMNEDGIEYEEVKNYITEDREYGKMYYTEFDGCWNFTYGIMVCNKNGNLNNQGIFEEYGYDLESLVNDAKSGKTVTVPMEDLEDIYAELIIRKYKALKDTLKEHDVELETWQNYALVNFCYQWGNCGQYIVGENNIAEVYKKYYVEQNNPEQFKNNAVLATSSGDLVKFFLAEYKLRQENAWIMFNEGRYILSDGEEIFVSGDSAELILEACVTVMNELLDESVRYSVNREGEYPLPSRIDIESFQGYGCCCCTYVARVLYVAGVLTADQIHSRGQEFHGTYSDCSQGLCAIIEAAGWTKVSEEDAIAGDVCIGHHPGLGHAFIYAGGDEVWDQTSGVASSPIGDSPYPATGGTISKWNQWTTAHDICVYRAP